MRRRFAPALAAAAAALLATPATAPALTQLPGRAGCVGGARTSACTPTQYDGGPGQPVADPSNRFVYGITRFHGVAAIGAFARESDGRLRPLRGPTSCVRRIVEGSAGLRAACKRARALSSPIDLWMAPDGFQVYALTAGSEPLDDGGVVTLVRGPNGGLHQASKAAGCITQLGKAGCAHGRSLDLPRRMTMSLDGLSMYVTSATGGLAVLRRDPDSGRLHQLPGPAGCVLSVHNPVGSSCARSPVPDAVPRDVAVSPDGAYVYALMARYERGAVAIYQRDADSGALTFAGCVAENGEAGCTPASGLAGGRSIAISPDGRSVYVAAHYFADGGTIASFSRDASTGALAPLDEGACMAAAPYPDCGAGPLFLDPSSLAVSHDGATVYVAYAGGAKLASGETGAVLAEFGRDPSTGRLSSATCTASGVKGCGRSRGVGGFNQVTVSVDGRTLYLGGRSVLGIFEIGGD